MKTFLFIFSLCISAPLISLAQEDTTMIQLIANPDKYEGKHIRVIGFLRLEFEGDVLYAHREDYENAILNGIWVNSSEEIIKNKNLLDRKYVLLEGVFSAKEKGHMGMWSGALTKINRSMIWSDPKKPRSAQ